MHKADFSKSGQNRLCKVLTRGSMNIDKLLSKRQHNVQEQNEILKNKIASEAIYWRQNGIPAPLENAFKSYQVDMSSSIVLDYEQDFPGICTDEGILLTSTGEFFKFEADLTPDRTKLIELYEFEDITNEFKITAHSKGTGATWGYLAIEALNEINCRFEKS